jgi:hypothetical protein
MKRLFILFFAGFSFQLQAQKIEVTVNKDSSYILERDARFDQVVARQKRENLLHQSQPGYRVQIYFGGNRPKAAEVKLDFNDRFPEIPAYMTYQQPNFKVRVGDFRSRYEAVRFLKKIEGMYATSFVVPDEIKLPPLD